MINVREITQNMLDKAIAIPKDADKFFGLPKGQTSKEIEIYSNRDILGEVQNQQDTELEGVPFLINLQELINIQKPKPNDNS